MELREFIKETLLDIIEGVSDAQKEGLEKGALVNPSIIDDFGGNPSIKLTSYNGIKRTVADVEFKVLLTRADGVEGKTGIGVFLASLALGVQSIEDMKQVNTTSIKFSVPIALPFVQTQPTKVIKAPGVKLTRNS